MPLNAFEQILSNERRLFPNQTVRLIDGLEKVLNKGSLFAYLVSMTLRLSEIHRVLKPTGCFYLHCDPSASHYLKIILDSIFCGQGGDFKNEIVWQRTNAHNTADRYGRNHDVLLFYTKSNTYTWNNPVTSFSPEQLKRYKKDSHGQFFTCQDLTASRDNSNSGKFEWRGTMPSKTRGWGYTIEQLEKWWQEGRIMCKKDGTPRMDGLIVYLKDKSGKPVQSVWTDIERIANTSAERLGYPTQKPEALLNRIIEASTNVGDVILDAYCGCGTTVAVAQRLNREWTGIDITFQSISLILKRLQDTYGKEALLGVTISGMPKDFASADALAHKEDDRLRKEFEKWCVLTFSNNRAMINEKKGSDRGIDGNALMIDNDTNGQPIYKDVLFSVKSDKQIKPSQIREFYGTIQRETAACGYFLCLNRPPESIYREAKQYGKYRNTLFEQDYPVLEIITVEDMLKGERIRIPASQRIEVLKSAAKAKTGKQQLQLFEGDEIQNNPIKALASKNISSRLKTIDRDVEPSLVEAQAKSKIIKE
jgi:DNA modification methylase